MDIAVRTRCRRSQGCSHSLAEVLGNTLRGDRLRTRSRCEIHKAVLGVGHFDLLEVEREHTTATTGRKPKT